jgi:hypothetical protein
MIVFNDERNGKWNGGVVSHLEGKEKKNASRI